MPISSQAKKRMRSDTKKNMQNKMILSKLKTLKKANTKAETKEEIEKSALILIKEYDKAASKGVIKKGKADRMKARISKKIHKLSA